MSDTEKNKKKNKHEKKSNTVNPFYDDWAFVPKGVVIKMNLLLYRILNEQIDI